MMSRHGLRCRFASQAASHRRVASCLVGTTAVLLAIARWRIFSESAFVGGQPAIRGVWHDVDGALANKRERTLRSRQRVIVHGATEVEMPLDQLVEKEGEYLTDVAPERLESLRKKWPSLDINAPGLRLLSDDPPVFVLEDMLTDDECDAFVESMRDKNGEFPERLGQSDLPAVPDFMNPLKNMFKGVPVLDWLGNPTVRWTYKSRNLLDKLVKKVRDDRGLVMEAGAANIKHYRQDQWLPVHIDYNYATMMVYLTDVAEGGHTMFPTLGFKVPPKKGSALVWPNQPPLKHAGDKVIDGNKWILFYNYPAESNWEYDDNFDFNDE